MIAVLLYNNRNEEPVLGCINFGCRTRMRGTTDVIIMPVDGLKPHVSKPSGSIPWKQGSRGQRGVHLGPQVSGESHVGPMNFPIWVEPPAKFVMFPPNFL